MTQEQQLIDKKNEMLFKAYYAVKNAAKENEISFEEMINQLAILHTIKIKSK